MGPHVAAKAGATPGVFDVASFAILLGRFGPCRRPFVDTSVLRPFYRLVQYCSARARYNLIVAAGTLAAGRQLTWPRQHWVYRRDGHRKCWFLAEGTATVRKPAHGSVAARAASPVENQAAQQRSSPMIDARVELLPSSPVDRAPPTPPARELKVVDAAPFSEASKPALMPARPVADFPTSQLTPEHSVPPQVDVEKLPAAVRADSPAAIPMAAHNEEVRDEPRSWTV
jgi:hypothetical protein